MAGEDPGQDSTCALARCAQVHYIAGTQSRCQTLCVSLAAVSVAKAHHDSMHRVFLCHWTWAKSLTRATAVGLCLTAAAAASVFTHRRSQQRDRAI